MHDQDNQQKNLQNKQEVQIDLEYRGYICNRLLSTSLPPLNNDLYLEKLSNYKLEDYENIGGELEYLSLSPSDLTGKTLDVGVGGGRSLLQGLQNGIDIHGIDLALKAKNGSLHPGGMSTVREQIARDCLRELFKTNPDRITEADATHQIPFPDNFFDNVIACLSLPIYARNLTEATTSILEMIRVAKNKVVFSTGYSSFPKPGDIRKFGIGSKVFEFSLIDFLESLKPYGVETTWKIVEVPEFEKEYDQDKVSAHLDVSKKNSDLLKQFLPVDRL